jgi:hypothetical protein
MRRIWDREGLLGAPIPFVRARLTMTTLVRRRFLSRLLLIATGCKLIATLSLRLDQKQVAYFQMLER